MAEPSTLLICTVGSSPEPIIAAFKRWRPVRVRFVHHAANERRRRGEGHPDGMRRGAGPRRGQIRLVRTP